MKRSFWLALFVVLLLSVCACGKSTTPEGNIAGENTLTWQEQYDLGVRLLAEGKYEEAILAFETAIQIDPKRADAYEKAVEAYVAIGDMEKALSILEHGVKATGDAGLVERQDQWKQTMESGSPEMEPDIPWVLHHSGFHCGYNNLYCQMTEEMVQMFMPLITVGQANDRQKALELVQEEALKELALELTKAVRDEEGELRAIFWTQWNGAVFFYEYAEHVDYYSDYGYVYNFEYRPVNGTAFYVYSCDYPESGFGGTDFLLGTTEDLVYQGEYTWINTYYYENGNEIKTIQGRVVDELMDGELVTYVERYNVNPEVTDSSFTSYALFDMGKWIPCGQRDDGTQCYMKRVYPDGDVSFTHEASKTYNPDRIYYLMHTNGYDLNTP